MNTNINIKDNNKCLFCNLTDTDKKYLLFSNKYWSLYLSDIQDYPGRCIIVCNEHKPDISSLSSDEWSSLKAVLTSTERMLKQELCATMINTSCLMNDAYKNDAPNPHIHFHIRPRFKNEIHFNCKKFIDKKFGHHYERHKKALDADAAEYIYSMLHNSVDKYFN